MAVPSMGTNIAYSAWSLAATSLMKIGLEAVASRMDRQPEKSFLPDLA
jgi:hypothetical protein